jgi:predicted RNA-binding protein YlxR (DUF448 family)
MEPQRTCIGCRRKGDQSSFFRVSREPGGRVVLYEGGPRGGRSGYICRNENCLALALSKERLARALKLKVTDDDKERIREAIACKLR